MAVTDLSEAVFLLFGRRETGVGGIHWPREDAGGRLEKV